MSVYPATDGRLRVLQIGQRDILNLLMGRARIVNLPKGATIHGDVYYDWHVRSFCLRIQHESFDVVPDGQLIPPFIAQVSPIVEFIFEEATMAGQWNSAATAGLDALTAICRQVAPPKTAAAEPPPEPPPVPPEDAPRKIKFREWL